MIIRRYDISEGLRRLRCRTLIFVGDSSLYYSDALHMASKLDRRYSALVEVYPETIHLLCLLQSRRSLVVFGTL